MFGFAYKAFQGRAEIYIFVSGLSVQIEDSTLSAYSQNDNTE